MKSYYRVMLGQKSIFAEQCFKGNFIGVDFGIAEDLTPSLPDAWREFNKKFIPVYLKGHPDKTKIAAGLACGNLWTVAKGIRIGDIVICPGGSGTYRVGEIISDYLYTPGPVLPHRRSVRWYNQTIDRAAMSDELRHSTGSIGTVCNIAGYQVEIEKLIGGASVPVIISNDPTVEDPSAFAMEQHLEDFLVQNWAQTELGKEYDVYSEEGERVGQQYLTDTGALDILAISKDKKRLLVVELKKGRASDVVVGQVLRYMGYVQEELAENGQTVSGVIIALEDDQRIRRALSVVPNVTFYRYQISFKLMRT
jgi:restriction system protein